MAVFSHLFQILLQLFLPAVGLAHLGVGKGHAREGSHIGIDLALRLFSSLFAAHIGILSLESARLGTHPRIILGTRVLAGDG